MKKRWEDWVNLVLGVWLFLSPWVLMYTMAQGAAWNAYVLGIAIAVFATGALTVPKPWEEWVNALLGLWLIVSPWIVGFTSQTAATWNAVILGIVILAISLKAARPSQRIHAAT